MSTTKPATGWTNWFTSAIGYYFVRERGEDAADASIIEYQGSERAYICGADDNFYQEWTSARYGFLGPFSAADFEQLAALREAMTEARSYIKAALSTGNGVYLEKADTVLRNALGLQDDSTRTSP